MHNSKCNQLFICLEKCVSRRLYLIQNKEVQIYKNWNSLLWVQFGIEASLWGWIEKKQNREYTDLVFRTNVWFSSICKWLVQIKVFNKTWDDAVSVSCLNTQLISAF